MLTNRKTTVAGVLAIIGAIITALVAVYDGDPTTVPDWNSVFIALMAGIGLLAAKDHNVTGGTLKQ